MSAASSGEKYVPGTLCATARRKSPAARGMASSAATDPPPAAGDPDQHRQAGRSEPDRLTRR